MNARPQVAIITVRKITTGSVFERFLIKSGSEPSVTMDTATRLSSGISFACCSSSRDCVKAAVTRRVNSTARAGGGGTGPQLDHRKRGGVRVTAVRGDGTAPTQIGGAGVA